MIDRELVTACYQAILKRSPENNEVIQDKLERVSTFEDLIREFLECEEYQQQMQFAFDPDYISAGRGGNLFSPRLIEPQTIEFDVSDKDLSYLFNRIKMQWTQLGETEPFWSVLTDPRYKADRMGAEETRSFFQSGEYPAGLIETLSQRNKVSIKRGVCLELGCGLGRVTRHLATRFEKVIAVDISASHLAHCRRLLTDAGVTNVDYVLLETPSDVAELPVFDFFFSAIVLQHNPPPIQNFIVDKVFSRIQNGGGFVFQTPAWMPNYSFMMKQYRAQSSGDMEMHCLPMNAIFSLAAQHKISMHEVVMDGWTGLYGSYTYFGSK